MPTASASRRIAAPAEQLWRIVSDPYHLPRWWPRVERVEGVAGSAFTEVMKTRAGKTVRADFELVRADESAGTVLWEQRVEGTPFAGVLASSATELRIDPAPSAGGVEEIAAATDVTIELRQEMAGESSSPAFRRRRPSWGGWLVRRAAERTLDEALDGLEAISA
jgi:uncharacterized protein YndB with AHSA1/START domain